MATAKTLTRSLERELKFSASPTLALPDLRGVVGTTRRPEQLLHASYYDSPDLRLWQQGITLRHRVGEGQAEGLWTLKLPHDMAEGVVSRNELSWSGPRHTMPAEVSTVLLGLLRHAELRPLFTLLTSRQRLALRTGAGDEFGELDDDRVTIEGGPNDGLRFRQLELELAAERAPDSEARQAARAVTDALTAAGANPGDGAKFAKALGPDLAAPPPGIRLTTKSLLSDVVRASLQDGLNRLLAHDYLLRLEAAHPDEEDVHQARVASRRLRSDLKTLRPILDPVWNDHTRDDLRWLGNLLGQVRDLDVFRAGLDSDALHDGDGNGRHPDPDRGALGISAELDLQRRGAVADLAQGLQSDRYLRLLDRLHAAATSPPLLAASPTTGPRHRNAVRADQRARTALPRVVGVADRSLRKRVRKVGRRPTDEQLHKIRIGAKQLRYASELATPVMGSPARRTAHRAKQLQTVLGDHHDAVFAESWLRSQERWRFWDSDAQRRGQRRGGRTRSHHP